MMSLVKEEEPSLAYLFWEPFYLDGLPLDVLVLDMEWHSQVLWPDCGVFVGRKGWGGYTWNTTLFPSNSSFVGRLHARHRHRGSRQRPAPAPSPGSRTRREARPKRGRSTTPESRVLTSLRIHKRHTHD